jgi:hypothetical protein
MPVTKEQEKTGEFFVLDWSDKTERKYPAGFWNY